MEDRDTMLQLARRALAHFDAGTTDQADAPMTMPVRAYTDPERYLHERQHVFKELPIAVGLTVELPAAGDYKAVRVLDTSVLLVRGDDGVARAFLNVCRHRGSTVCPAGRGNARVFACPYHAWTYDRAGLLTGRYGASTFGDVDEATLGLVELCAAERAGVIFAVLSPLKTFDIDDWLGDFAAELGTLELHTWHLHEQRDIAGPGWKVTMDGYLESYHHALVHQNTVGKHTVGNLLVLDTWGPHQRLTFGRQSLGELRDTRQADWQPGEHIRLIHSCFPNLSISGILGGHCLVSQIYPGPTPTTTVTTQTVLAARPPVTPEERDATQAFSELTLAAVRDEDYAIGHGIQGNVMSIENANFVFGRNEPAVQNYHRWVARFMDERAGDANPQHNPRK